MANQLKPKYGFPWLTNWKQTWSEMQKHHFHGEKWELLGNAQRLCYPIPGQPEQLPVPRESALTIKQQWPCAHPGQDTPTWPQFILAKSTFQSAADMNCASPPSPSHGCFIQAQTHPIGLSVKNPHFSEPMQQPSGSSGRVQNSPVLVSLQPQPSRAEFHPSKTIQPLCGQEFRIYWKITTWRKHSSRAAFVNICWHLEPSQTSSQFMQSRQKLIITLTIIFSGSQVMTVHEQHRNKVLNYLWCLKHLNQKCWPFLCSCWLLD